MMLNGGRTGGRTPRERDAAEGISHLWHALFHILLLLATVLASSRHVDGLPAMWAWAVGLDVWYVLLVQLPERRGSERRSVQLLYFAGLAVAFVVLTGFSEEFLLLLYVVYVQVFVFLGPRWGVVGVVVVTLVWSWRRGLLDDVVSEPRGLLVTLGSTATAAVIGYFLWAVVGQSEQRRTLIDELDHARDELRGALEERRTLFDAGATLAGTRSADGVVAALGGHLGDGVQEVVLFRGFEVAARWPARGAPLRGAVAVPVPVPAPPDGVAVLRAVDELPTDVAEAWRHRGCGALAVVATTVDAVPVAVVATAARRTAVTPRDLRVLEALVPIVGLALENQLLLGRARDGGVEQERARLAREIHDTLAQGFTSVVMQLEAAEQELERRGDVRGHLDRARATSRESLAAVRRTVRDLRPDLLDDGSLSDALARTTRRTAERSRLRADTVVTGDARPLHPDAEVTLLRVAQEALANVVRHADATRARVTLSYGDDAITLDVRDDGVGLDGAALSARPEGGFGLHAMRERVEALAGELTVESGDGAGTTVVATVPLAPAGNGHGGGERT